MPKAKSKFAFQSSKTLHMKIYNYFLVYNHSLFPFCDTNAPVSLTVDFSTTPNINFTDSSGVRGRSKVGVTFLKLAIMLLKNLSSSGVAADQRG